ncbi:MAG: GNAT family N-acetyltransferase, partial [Christensenellaceae bacterium]
GLDQWQNKNGYPDASDALSDIEEGVGRVLKEDGVIVGAAAFVDYESDYEQIYEGNWRAEGEYLAVHRVTVDTQRHGRGYASLLFAAAEAEAREREKVALRIDTHERNRPMRRALEKSGFVLVGKIRLSKDGAERVAYEKVLS